LTFNSPCWRYRSPGPLGSGASIGAAPRQVAVLVAVNLAVNLIFFMTHPIFTPYYIIPIDMLSLWTLLFATLDLRGERVAESAAFPQPANA
jgi:hypothetical protein